MVFLALLLMSAAVLIGVAMAVRILAVRHLSSPVTAAVHGLLGASALGALVYRLVNGVPVDDRYGAASFGPASATLAALAVLAGVGTAVLGRRFAGRRGLLMAVHASVAVAAYVLLLAYALLT